MAEVGNKYPTQRGASNSTCNAVWRVASEYPNVVASLFELHASKYGHRLDVLSNLLGFDPEDISLEVYADKFARPGYRNEELEEGVKFALRSNIY
jgi:hypothetical protein